MYREMGIQPSAGAVASHYEDLIDGFVIDDRDSDLKQEILHGWEGSLNLFSTDIWMKTRADRITVAEEILTIGKKLVKEV
jgi:2-phospho-L-lactate transferase/gluconeogenesis factor (CofD/UPF0052 family)